MVAVIPTKIFAHRGASKMAPENTLAAFELAYQLGADGIETDVHLTKDNVPVLIHDEHVKRTTNGSGYIKDFTFNEIKQLDAGSWFAHTFTGTTIISLEEFLQWIQSKPLHVNIELKNNKIDYKNIESIVFELVCHYQLLNRTILSTFNPNSIKQMKSMHNEVGIALLTSKQRKNMVSYIKSLGANAVHIKYRLLKTQLIEQCHQENIAVRVYTVNKFPHLIRCFAQRCDAVFTDVPNKGVKYRNLFLKRLNKRNGGGNT